MSTRAWHRFRKQLTRSQSSRSLPLQPLIQRLEQRVHRRGTSALEVKLSMLDCGGVSCGKGQANAFRATGSHVDRKAGSPSWNVRFASNCWRSIS